MRILLDWLLIIKIGKVAVKLGSNIARQFAAFQLIAIRHQDAPLQLEPAIGVDGVRDIRMKL